MRIFVGVLSLLMVSLLYSPLVYSSHLLPDCSAHVHVCCGTPGTDTLLERQGYVIAYNADRRVPKWVAYKIEPDYRKTPQRKGKFKSFRKDPDVVNPVVDRNYTGLSAARGFARGHLAPYGVMGGDRDGDGLYARDDDEHDVLTVKESNYMSNVAPQHHTGFNGSGGLWFDLERWIQDDLVKEDGKTVWIFAGTIFGPGTPEGVGPQNDIAVPPMFFKVMIEESFSVDQPHMLAFLFPHQRVRHGNIEDFLVSIDVLEGMTELDFFSQLDPIEQTELEDTDTWEYWKEFYEPWWHF